MWPRETEFLAANLAALAQRQPQVARVIERARPEAGETTVDFAPTPRGPVLTLNGRALASRVDPVREGQALARAHQDLGVPLVFGLGAGYHLAPLVEKYSFLWVVEPEPLVARAALSLADFRPLWPRVGLIVGRLGLDRPPWPTALIPHAPTVREWREEYSYWQGRLSWPQSAEAAGLLAPWPDLAARAAAWPEQDYPLGPVEFSQSLQEAPGSSGRLLLALLLLLNKSEGPPAF